MTQDRLPGRALDASAGSVDESTLRWAVDVVRLVRSPVFTGMVVAVVLALAGAITLVVSGFGAHDQVYVALQVPHLVSGGFGGVALIIVGCLVASTLGNRRDSAMADEELAAVTAEIVALSRATLRNRETS